MVQDLGIPAGRVDETHDHADGRRLAGAVGPQEPEDIAFADREVEPVNRRHALEAFGESVSRQHDGLLRLLRADDGTNLLRLHCKHPGTRLSDLLRSATRLVTDKP